MIKNTDLSYIAGYIDGDKCFYIGKRKRKNTISPTLQTNIIIVSVNPKVLEWIQSLFEGSISSRKQGPEKHKRLYNYVLRKTRAIPFVNMIIHFLVEKRQEAAIFIKYATMCNPKENNFYINEMKKLKKSSNLVYKELKEELEPYKNTVIPSDEDFAYLAGFIDAECCLSIQKDLPKGKPNHTYKTCLTCSNTKAPIFKWLLQRFGGFIFFVKRNKPGSNQRDQFMWRISGATLAKILPKIYQFLKHKKPVCRELMNLSATILPNGGDRQSESFKSRYAQILAKREEIVTKIHILNSKGT